MASMLVSTMVVDFNSTNVADGKALCLYLMRACPSLVPVGIQFVLCQGLGDISTFSLYK